MDDVIVRLVDLPCTTGGYILEDPAGDYNVYLNSRLSLDQQRRAYLHELAHIRHLHSEMPAELCEDDAKSKSARAAGRLCNDDDDRLTKPTLFSIPQEA